MANTEPEGPPPDHAVAPEGRVPANLLYTGVIVGLILIFLGIWLLYVGRGSVLSSLMTCVGFGIVLASFGTKAAGAWAGWTVTGAGATSIVLFLVLQYYQPVSTLVHYKKGQLRGDLSKIADIHIIDELPMYEYRDRTTSSIRFVLLDNKLRSSRLSIQVDTTEKGPGKEFFEMLGDGKAIESRYLSEGTDSAQQIQWTFDYDRRVVRDGADIIFSEQESLPEKLIPVSRSGFLDWLPTMDIQIARAFAQGTDQQSATVENLVTKLKSDDTAVRRNARDDLAALGPSAVGAMLSALRANPNNYRVRLGVVYGLSDMLRRNPDQRSIVSSAIKDEDFPALVAAASDDDKTIRLQATDFLYLLQDQRALPSSIEAARNTSDPNKATNQLLIIRQSGQSLDQSKKQKGSGVKNDYVGNAGFVKDKLGIGW